MGDPTDRGEQAPPPCEHIGFEANVEVVRLTDEEHGSVTGYRANVRVWCAMCGSPFTFAGVEAGYDPGGPMTSIDGRELRLPVWPAAGWDLSLTGRDADDG